MKQLMIQILFRVGTPVLAGYAVFYNNEWADNFVTFISIILLIGSFLIMATNDKKNDSERKGSSLPYFTWHLMCCTMIGVLVFAGWFWLVTTWMFIWLFGAIAKEERDKAENEMQAT